MRGIHFGVGQRPLRMAIREGVGHALLARRHILAAKDIKQFRALQTLRLGLADGLQHGVVRGCLRDEHCHITANRRERGQRLEGFAQVAAREQHIKIQLRQQHGVAQVIALGEGRQQLAKLAEHELAAERHGGGFEKQRGAVRAPRVSDATQTELLQEFLQQALEVVKVELRGAVVAAPESRRALTGQRDGDAAFLARSAGSRARAFVRRRVRADRAVRAPEHPADLEERHVLIATAQVVPQRM